MAKFSWDGWVLLHNPVHWATGALAVNHCATGVVLFREALIVIAQFITGVGQSVTLPNWPQPRSGCHPSR